MMKTLLIISLIVTALYTNCSKRFTPNQHLALKDITIDSSYGYPYPSNYNWKKMVQEGSLCNLPLKTKHSDKPLQTLYNSSFTEVYRITDHSFRFFIAITKEQPTTKLSFICLEQATTQTKDSTDDLVKKEFEYVLSVDESIILKRLLKNSKFWSTPITGFSNGGNFDGYTLMIEGIKDSLYSFVAQDTPDVENKNMYELEKWLYDFAKNKMNENKINM